MIRKIIEKWPLMEKIFTKKNPKAKYTEEEEIYKKFSLIEVIFRYFHENKNIFLWHCFLQKVRYSTQSALQ